MKQEIVVKYVAIIVALLLTGCKFDLFEKGDNLLASYKLANGKIIEVHSIEYGATTKDITIIGIKDAEGETLDTLKRIEDSSDIYKIDIVRVNDTMFQLKLTDTTFQTGKTKYISFNIKSKGK